MSCRKMWRNNNKRKVVVVAAPGGALTPKGFAQDARRAYELGIPEAWAIREMLMAYEGR